MFVYKQGDSRWADKTIGNTDLTLARWGCTITSICMLFTKFYRKSLYPNEVCKTWKFTDKKTYPSLPEGLILWHETDFDGMEFVKRGYGYNKEEIKKYAQDKNYAVIVEVENRHWCAVTWFGGTWPVLADPWTGSTLWWWWLRYNSITGYAVFRKENVK